MRLGWLEETMNKREMAVGISKGVEITAVGCPFFNRCPLAIEGTCDTVTAPVRELKDGHQISCHLTIDQLEQSEAQAAAEVAKMQNASASPSATQWSDLKEYTMSDYPNLDSMGVQNPNEISRYAIFSTDDSDVLRIVYSRKKGSILPVSRKYRFPRMKKSVIVDSGTRQTNMIFESSNEFRNAVAELDKLLKKKSSGNENKNLILEELRMMEEESALRLNYIRSLIDKME